MYARYAQMGSKGRTMNNENLGLENIQPTKRVSGIWDKLRTRLMVLSLFGLITLNVLTLVNDQVHAVGYSVIGAVIASAVTDAVVARVLSGSPTVAKQRAVSIATSEFEKSNRAMLARNAAVTKQFTDLSNKHAVVTKQFTDLSIRHTDLEKTHGETEAKHSNLKQKSEKRSSLVSAISKRIGKRAAMNAAKNLSSFALEVIPVVGVAAIVTLTASDLYDDCQTMKDVNELNVEFELQSEDADKVCGLRVPTFGK